MITAIVAILIAYFHLEITWFVYLLPVLLDLVIIDKIDKE